MENYTSHALKPFEQYFAIVILKSAKWFKICEMNAFDNFSQFDSGSNMLHLLHKPKDKFLNKVPLFDILLKKFTYQSTSKMQNQTDFLLLVVMSIKKIESFN